MLSNLDKVDWDELGANQVPQLISAIYESDPKEKGDWQDFATLREMLYPEGMEENWDWGAPGHMMQNDLPQQVTPFLIEILEDTKSIRKMYAVIGLLADLFKYEDYRLWVGDDGSERQTEYIEWSRRLRDQVRLGLPLYQQCLTSSDEYLRERTQELIKWLDYKS